MNILQEYNEAEKIRCGYNRFLNGYAVLIDGEKIAQITTYRTKQNVVYAVIKGSVNDSDYCTVGRAGGGNYDKEAAAINYAFLKIGIKEENALKCFQQIYGDISVIQIS